MRSQTIGPANLRPCRTLTSYNSLSEILRYLIKTLVRESNHWHAHASAIIRVVRLKLPNFVDLANWEWEVESKAEWKLAKVHWQNFYAKWYGAMETSLVDPNLSPSLSLESLPDTFDPSISSSSTIFIRGSYVTMFNTVWVRSVATKGRKGVIITGQPGTGKTLFNYYLLVRLLQLKQVVLFSPDGDVVYLFYGNEVFTVGMGVLASQGIDVPLPRPISRSSNVFIWTLFDIRDTKGPAKFLTAYPCFPVQTASPNPVRYATWEKERFALLTGLPLWSREELAQGYVLPITYFCPCLSAYYPG